VRLLQRPRWRRLLQGTRLHRLQAQSPSVERASFDQAVARALTPCMTFIGENSSSLHSLIRAGELGAFRILLQHNHSFRELLGDLEAERLRWGGPPPFIDPNLLAGSQREQGEADRIVCFSNSVRQSLVRDGLPAGRLVKIGLGVDPQRFRPCLPSSGGSGFTVGFIGWLDLRKGYPYLVEAFRRASLPGSTLVLHGGSSIPYHHDLVERLRGDSRVLVTTGPVETTFARLSVAVLPSVSDGYGLSALEAMACGVPVIVTSNCGVSEDLVHGREGFVVPARDSDAIATHLVQLHDSPSLRESMGVAARQRALQCTWDRFASGLGSLLRDVPGGSAR
jgi:glycosyltransferase involved in cell wall biosynthesis